MRSSYMLPNGNCTHDVNLYVDTWRQLGKDVCSLLPGSYTIAFDPGLLISRDKVSTLSVPTDLALAIQKLINSKVE